MKRFILLAVLLVVTLGVFACGNTEQQDPCASGHDFGAWQVSKAATCEAKGEEKRVCSRDASHVETREIDALGHLFGEWHQSKAPTCVDKGEEKRVCSRCPKEETREVAALGHTFVDGKCSVCGAADPDFVPPLERLDAFDTALENPSTERQFRDGIDVMIEDFSSAEGRSYASFLRVLADNKADPAPVTGDAALYKMASGVYQFEQYAAIGFRIRVVKGTIGLNNLVLALRGDDAYELYEINLADALDIDGDALPELTSEFQDFIICPNLSIEDDTTEYLLKNGEKSGVKVLDKYLGFHLYVKGDCSAILDIEEVFLFQTEKQVLDTFDRYDVGAGDASVCWWRGSTGFIVKAGSNQNMEINATALEGKDNLVLNVLGDATNVTINGKAWAELKDNENKALAMPVNGAWHQLVINLINSGLSGNLVIVNDGGLNISQVFASNLETKPVVTEYPLISTEYINIFDDFNRTQSGFNGDYDASSTNPIVTGAGLNYALSYNNGDKVTVDGCAEFDATELAASDYINFKEGKNNYQGEPYLVLVLKPEDGATFNDFRFNVGNGVVYYNNMFSAYGLHLPAANATNYPYTDEDGFMWIVIDLEESGMEPNPSDGFIDFYYSGSGKLLIDAVFFTYAQGAEPSEPVKPVEVKYLDGVQNADLSGYGYIGGFENNQGTIQIRLELTGVGTLATLRFGDGAGAEKYFNKGEIFGADGEVIDATLALSDTPLVVVVDLEASGMKDWSNIHLHSGGWEEGNITVDGYLLNKPAEGPKLVEVKYLDGVQNADLSGYGYIGGFENNQGTVQIRLELTGVGTLATLRFGDGAGAEKYFNKSEIFNEEGEVIDAGLTLGDTPLVIVVDLEASGMKDWANIHLHSGGWEEGNITVDGFLLNEPAEEPEPELVEVKYLDGVQNADLSGYGYIGGFDNNQGTVQIRLELTGSGTLATLRFGDGAGAEKYFNKSEIFNAEGEVIDAGLTLSDTPLVIVVDLEASGMKDWANIHLHSGGWEEGNITVDGFLLNEPAEEPELVEVKYLDGVQNADLSGYGYIGGFDNNQGTVQIRLELTGVGTLATLRFGDGAGAEKYFNKSEIFGADGEVIDAALALSDTPLVVVVDLEASGMKEWTNIHLHSGGWEEGNITVDGYLLNEPAAEKTPYQEVMEVLLEKII